MASNKGFTGTSILHTYLYPLYKFDILFHMVYDSFHTICLNVVKNQLERLLELELLDQTKLDELIESFPWTKELKDGRIPKATKNYKELGQWKAEGLHLSYGRLYSKRSFWQLSFKRTRNSVYDLKID